MLGVGRVHSINDDGTVTVGVIRKPEDPIGYAGGDATVHPNQLEEIKEVARLHSGDETPPDYPVGTRVVYKAGATSRSTPGEGYVKQPVETRRPDGAVMINDGDRGETTVLDPTKVESTHVPAEDLTKYFDAPLAKWEPKKAAPEPQSPPPPPQHKPPLKKTIPKPAPKRADVVPDRSTTAPSMPDGLAPYQRAALSTVAVSNGNRNVLRKVDEEKLRAANAELEARLKNAEVHVRFTGDLLAKVVEDGRLKSMFETGYSGGFEDKSARATLESGLFNLHAARTPSAARPIYGFVTDAPDGALATASAHTDLADLLEGYGDVSLVLKPHMHDRTTITIHDSLVDAEAEYRRTPSELRAKLPFAPAALTEPLPIGFADGATDDVFRTSDIASMQSYIEAQIHGGVSVHDIHHIVMTAEVYQELDAVILSQLIGLGIEIQVVR